MSKIKTKYEYEFSFGVRDPNAPLRRALRWSDPELFILKGKEWIEGVAARRGSRAWFFGLDIEFGRNRNRVLRFFLLTDKRDKRRFPTPRGYAVAIGLERVYLFDHNAHMIKRFFREVDL